MTTTSPTLKLEITKENYDEAVKASSGGCLVADAIKRQYPHLSRIEVDTATIRVTDKKRAERYVYLTPRTTGEYLLAFDQGWPEEFFPRKITIRNAVRIMPIEHSASMRLKTAEKRSARLAKLQAKEKSGETLTEGERSSLGRLLNPKQAPERPIGPPRPQPEGGSARHNLVIRGGRHPSTSNPNLLHGTDRHFGAKMARPSVVWQQALKNEVKTAVQKYKAKQRKAKKS